jgi:hypothetical protein
LGIVIAIVVAAFAILIGVMSVSPEIRQQLFAKFLIATSDKFNAMSSEYKHELFATLPQDGRVVEIGPGPGANFAYFPTKLDDQGRKGNFSCNAHILIFSDAV